jgi:hypothetical protein
MLGCRRIREFGGVSWLAAVSGWCGDRWLPRVAGQRGADSGDDVGFMFADGVDVAADVEAVLGDVFAGEPT